MIHLHNLPAPPGARANSLRQDMELDPFDRQILEALRANARLSNLELAQRVALSHSAISRRIKRLEDEGVIKGYAARIDPEAAGESVRAFVGVARQASVSAMEVAEALRRISGVVSCWIVSGDYDIMIELAARDMTAFSAAMLNEVQTAKGVAGTRSMLVLSALKER